MPSVEKRKTTISLPVWMMDKLDEIAKKRGLNRSTLIQLILEEYLRNHEEE